VLLLGLAHATPGVAPERPLTPAQISEDVAAFRRDVLERGRAFSAAARSDAAARLAALDRTRRPMKPGQLGLELCKIAALADDGHTFCDLPASRFNQVPLELALLSDGLLVLGTDPPHHDLLGGRLVAIAGHPIEEIRTRLRTLFGGEPSHRDLMAFPFLKSPEVLRAIDIADNSAQARYRVALGDGRVIERDLVGGPASSRDGWTWLMPAERMPWVYQQLGESLRWRDAPELDAVVAQIRFNDDSGGRRIADFLAEVAQSRLNLRRRNFVLDLRFDGGGDLSKTRDFMVGLPGQIGADGTVAVLIGPATFSAGLASAAYLRQAGGSRVLLIGQPPGDRLTFFAEAVTVTLPRSKLRFLAATARHDYRDGCRAYDDCYVGVAQPGRPHGSPAAIAAIVRPIPVAIPSLAPDIPAPFTMDAFRSGRDPAIEAAALALRRGR